MILRKLLRPSNTRERLLRDLVAVILLTTGAITAVTLVQGTNMRNNIAQEHIRQGLVETTDRIVQFYEPVQSTASLIQKWGMAGIWQMEDLASVTATLIPLMENLPQVSAIKFGSTAGRSYLLTRNKNIWLTRTSYADRPGETVWKQWVDGQMINTRVEEKEYDFKARTWYREGLALARQAQSEVAWLQPYMFDYEKTPVLSAVMTWSSGDDAQDVSVMALDVPLKELFLRITESKVGASGTAFLFNGDKSVYYPLEGETSPALNRFILDYTEVPNESIREAMAAWHAKDRPEGAFVFSSGGQARWAGMAPIGVDNRYFWVGVVVPQSEFLQKLIEKRWAIVLVGLGIFGFGLAMAGFLVWKYRHQLRDLPTQVIRDGHFEDDVRKLISQGEGTTLEFKSTMRMNLKTEKNDKNIEVAWMKGVSAFMNTDGGIIVIGVNDDGEVVGTVPDGFENEDKCRLHFRNLISQHIGLEFTKYIHLYMGLVDGHTVMVIECERADKPVFLINRKDESFYVRSGPSSVALTMRQMLKYLESRK